MDKWIVLLAILGVTASVEVHFETPDSGFFLKHTPRSPASSLQLDPSQKVSISTSSSSASSSRNQESILSLDKFTVVQTAQPVSIRASYGPFSTKQTVPARYIVPDVVTDGAADSDQSVSTTTTNTTAALLDLQQSNVHLDISAHLVRQTIPRDSPVLRVLFHAGADPGGHVQRQKVCVLLHVSMSNRAPLKGRCMPEGEDGVCVAEVIIPSNWWPPIPAPVNTVDGKSPQKTPQRVVQVSYSVFEPPMKNPELCEPKVQIQPLTTFAKVPLVQAETAYKELRADDLLTMLVPHHPLYPLSKIHVPVFLQLQPEQNIAVFIVRARVKAGMRILGATASSDEWNISIEKENPKHTVARVTAFRKDRDPDSVPRDIEETQTNKIIEVFSWLIEVANDTKEHFDSGRIVWSVSYVHDGPKLKENPEIGEKREHEEPRKKLIAKVDIQKDDIQAVLPISKNWELMNTAVLTGRQVSQAMKVFIVSQAGKIADVTLQSSCYADDESVVKVSSSCSSVYVDGSEGRGSSNATIVVKYGTYSGLAKFIVWMPEFPLEVSVADFRLSQIKGWRVPDEHNNVNGKLRRKRAYSLSHHSEDYNSDRGSCKARYQQSPVEVYARFLAVDQDSGRVSYLISRRTALRVTDLVQPLFRVADPKIATLRGRMLQGKSPGRTDIQVLSPITGRVIGTKEIRVSTDKVQIKRLHVRVVSGLQLTITPDTAIENGYIAETTVTRKLTAQYQEGLMDIDIEFDDGSRSPLRDISVDDYFLLVESLDTEVVAFAPMLASHHPRVIAVGQGHGDLLRVTLLLPEECRSRRNIPLLKPNNGGKNSASGPTLATALASVEVDFGGSDTSKSDHSRPDTVQNDGTSRGYRGRDLGDLADILIGIPLKDASHHEPTVQARQHRGMTALDTLNGMVSHKSSVHSDMTTIEIGMYVLLAAFCLAIAVFVVSCVVYASKFKPVPIEAVNGDDGERDVLGLGVLREMKKGRDSTQNAHDWVWLGRNTVDRNSMAVDAMNGNMWENARDSRIRITSNPMMYANAEAMQVNSFETPQRQYRHYPMVNSIDSATYCKKDRFMNGQSLGAPPLPPHGVPIIKPQRPDYRPPVPPHRNIGVTANIGQPIVGNGEQQEFIVPRRPPKHHLRQGSNGIINPFFAAVNPVPSTSQQQPQPASASHRIPQQHAATSGLFSNNPPQYLIQAHELQRNGKSPKSPRRLNLMSFEGVELVHHNANRELHQAEKLVETANNFQFDTMTPKKPQTLDLEPKNGDEERKEDESAEKLSASPLHISENDDEDAKNKTLESSSDDNGGFVTPPGMPRTNRVKRATVVGNPMFSNTPDSEIGPGESLGLDDLDMDYEQIMHYFDNLKESNA
ncbi:transmembrane protein 132E [Culicoides brevitarsis]|uniref:transmembrane protein 132E n=1 Tax=Culicoides brevitarsis TaxID=469753 RepID=UPI00307BBC97